MESVFSRSGMCSSSRCDVNARKRYGLIPLHMAVAYGHADVTKTLLKNGADPNAKSDEHETPLDLAKAGSHLK